MNYLRCEKAFIMNKVAKYFVATYWNRSYSCSSKFISQREAQWLRQYSRNLLSGRVSLLSCQRSEFCRSSINLDENKIKKILSLPENKLNQFNIINSNELLQTISELENVSDFITERDLQKLVHLIKAALEKEDFSNFSTISKFWEFALSTQDRNFTEQFLSEFLVLCLRSAFPVSCQDILDLLERKYIQLSQNLGELLIANLCSQGKIDETEEMLHLMKSQGLRIDTENIYSYLISLKGTMKDLDGLREILYAMKSDKFDHSAVTKSALVVAYNKCGSFGEAKMVLMEVAGSNSKFSLHQYRDLLLSAFECGALEKDVLYLTYIINAKMALAGDVGLKEVIMRLLRTNYYKEVVYLLSTEKAYLTNSHLNSNVSVFIQELINVKYNDPPVVLDFCDKLVRNNLNVNAFEVALEMALTQKYVELSWALLKQVKNRRVLRDHFFWPLFAMEANNEDNVAKTLEVLSGMSRLKVDIGLETLQSYVIPNLSLETPMLTLQILSKQGVSNVKAITPFLAALMWKRKFHEAVDLVQECQVPYRMNSLLLTPLAVAYQHDRKLVVETFYKLLNHSKEFKLGKSGIYNKLISLICKTSKGKLKRAEVTRYVQSFEKISLPFETSKDFYGDWSTSSQNKVSLEHDVGEELPTDMLHENSESSLDVSDTSEGIAQNQYRNDEIFDSSSPSLKHISAEKFEESKDSNIQDKSSLRPQSSEHESAFIHPNDMSVEELEAHLVELKSKDMNTRGVLRKLLLKHSTRKNETRVAEITKELKAMEAESSPGMLSTLLYNKVLEGNAEEAIEIFYALGDKFPQFTVDSYKIIDLCSLLARLGKVQESVEVMREYIKKVPKTYHHKNAIRKNCFLLLTECSNIGGYSSAREMCSLLLTGGLAGASSVLFGPLIKSKLSSNNLIGAVEEAEDIFETHKVLPMRVEIIINLLNSNDPNLGVQDLVDRICALIAKDRGLRQARQDLLSAAVQVQDVEQATEIYKHVEEDLEMQNIRSLCDYFAKHEKVGALQTLLSASKESSVIDRMYICESLLNIYFINRNSKDALDLSTVMQEELLTPSGAFSNKLHILLKSTASAASEIPLTY